MTNNGSREEVGILAMSSEPNTLLKQKDLA